MRNKAFSLVVIAHRSSILPLICHHRFTTVVSNGNEGWPIFHLKILSARSLLMIKMRKGVTVATGFISPGSSLDHPAKSLQPLGRFWRYSTSTPPWGPSAHSGGLRSTVASLDLDYTPVAEGSALCPGGPILSTASEATPPFPEMMRFIYLLFAVWSSTLTMTCSLRRFQPVAECATCFLSQLASPSHHLLKRGRFAWTSSSQVRCETMRSVLFAVCRVAKQTVLIHFPSENV